MLTNTYLPHVGGVARSVSAFTEALRQRGHHVLVVAPTYPTAEAGERDGVFRVPAIQQFNASDFSVRLPIPGLLAWRMERFGPDLLHAHHPFLLGDTALRMAAGRGLPIVFTHHTMYEHYTHYVPGDSPPMVRFVKRMVTDYANLCDHIIAPSESIAGVLTERGVTTPISAIPTGINPHAFAHGDGAAMRRRCGIPAGATVVGHVGRLAPEKNLEFLSRALCRYLCSAPAAHALIVGEGPSGETIRDQAQQAGVAERLHMPGKLTGRALAEAYQAMDLFAFASLTETQGMVLAEAMSVGVPVVAVDAPGAREVVVDQRNGRLLPEADEAAFAAALAELAALSPEQRRARRQACCRTAEHFAMDRCVDRLLEVYDALQQGRPKMAGAHNNAWSQTRRLLELEWHLWSARANAAAESIREGWRSRH
jgi:glycosyltransferase involved in cell wall biosynthesis